MGWDITNMLLGEFGVCSKHNSNRAGAWDYKQSDYGFCGRPIVLWFVRNGWRGRNSGNVPSLRRNKKRVVWIKL